MNQIFPYILLIINLAIMRNFETLFDNFNELGMCANRNCTRKLMSSQCNYQFWSLSLNIYI
jgi:hypothetical protein